MTVWPPRSATFGAAPSRTTVLRRGPRSGSERSARGPSELTLHLVSEGPLESVLGLADRGLLVRMELPRLALRLGRLAPSPGARSRAPTSRRPPPARASARRLSWPLAASNARPWPSLSSPASSIVTTWSGRSRQANQVRDGRAAATDPPGDLLLAEVETVDQLGARAGLLDRIQILPRHVLDQRHLQAFCLVLGPEDRRDGLEAGLPRRPPPTLAGDQLVATVAERLDDERLDDAALADRFGEAIEGIVVEGLARLAGVGRISSTGTSR